MRTVMVTGHRYIPQHAVPHLRQRVKSLLTDAQRLITGMAIGWDQLCAQSAHEVGVPFHAYVPCLGQDNLWPPDVRREYARLLDAAEKVVIVSNMPYKGAWQMHRRNEAMLEAAAESPNPHIVAYWNGRNGGGTYHCLSRAKALCPEARCTIMGGGRLDDLPSK